MSAPYRDPEVPLAPEQLELRKRVLKEIENDPAAFSMSSWEANYHSFNLRTRAYDVCTTTRCIAGWAQFLARGRCTADDDGVSSEDLENDAIALLGLTEAEFDPPGNDQADDQLFYMNDDDALARLRELAAS